MNLAGYNGKLGFRVSAFQCSTIRYIAWSRFGRIVSTT
jgi:hypothetical protein